MTPKILTDKILTDISITVVDILKQEYETVVGLRIQYEGGVPTQSERGDTRKQVGYTVWSEYSYGGLYVPFPKYPIGTIIKNQVFPFSRVFKARSGYKMFVER